MQEAGRNEATKDAWMGVPASCGLTACCMPAAQWLPHSGSLLRAP